MTSTTALAARGRLDRPIFDVCHLHIGEAKTGTSSIQNTLFAARERLLADGYFYPGLESNHLFLVSAGLSNAAALPYNIRARKSGTDLQARDLVVVEEFERLGRESGARQLVISSEHFGWLRGDDVTGLADYLRSLAKTVRVHRYVRHPLALAVSRIQETVKNGAARLAPSLEKPPVVGHRRLVPVWVDAFGREAIGVYPFDRAQLVDNDVVSDFLYRIGYDEADNPLERISRNESLSAAGVLIADALGSFAPKLSPDRGPAAYLQDIEGPKFQVSKQVTDRVLKRSKPHQRYLKQEFGVTIAPPSSPEGDVVTPESALDEAALRSIAQQMINLQRKADKDRG